MSGEWTGAGSNRVWRQAGHRGGLVRGDEARGKRIYAELADTPFVCDTCTGLHPLREHRDCRAGAAPKRAAP